MTSTTSWWPRRRAHRGSPRDELVGVEGAREQLAEGDRIAPLAGVHEQLGAAVLEQDLAAAPARGERLPVAGRHAEGDQAAVPARHERGDEAALGAQREPVGGVLDVAGGDDLRRPAASPAAPTWSPEYGACARVATRVGGVRAASGQSTVVAAVSAVRHQARTLHFAVREPSGARDRRAGGP